MELYENKEKTLELTYQHLCTRKDDCNVIDPWENADDHKQLNRIKCGKENVARVFVKYGSKFDLNLSNTCKVCTDYRRKEDERRKRGDFKEK